MLLAGHGLKIKTVPIAAPPTYIFFFSAVHTRNGARCRAVWRRRRKAGTDEVKRNKNQSNPPKRKKKKKKKNIAGVQQFFFLQGLLDYIAYQYLPRHTYI